MGKSRKKEGAPSRPEWNGLDDWVRQQVRQVIQHALEDEVTEFLGRQKSERRATVEATPGYRNSAFPSRERREIPRRSFCLFLPPLSEIFTF